MFSVVMPIYNHAEYLDEAVRSVVDQTFEDWELIMVDDGSVDQSPQIAETWASGDSRISFFQQVNSGQAAARNKALTAAKGKWVTFLDSDDVYLGETLSNFHDFLVANPQAEFVYGYRHRLNADGSITELAGQFQDEPTGPVELFPRMYLSHPNICIRRELLEKVSGYDPDLRRARNH